LRTSRKLIDATDDIDTSYRRCRCWFRNATIQCYHTTGNSVVDVKSYQRPTVAMLSDRPTGRYDDIAVSSLPHRLIFKNDNTRTVFLRNGDGSVINAIGPHFRREIPVEQTTKKMDCWRCIQLGRGVDRSTKNHHHRHSGHHPLLRNGDGETVIPVGHYDADEPPPPPNTTTAAAAVKTWRHEGGSRWRVVTVRYHHSAM
jgi:hypothetical protein